MHDLIYPHHQPRKCNAHPDILKVNPSQVKEEIVVNGIPS